MQPEAGEAPFIAPGYFKPPTTGMFKHATDRRHFAGQYHGQTAERIHVFLHFRKPWIDGVCDVIQFGPRIGVRPERAGAFAEAFSGRAE